tara:strand:- start:1381 stop:1671 length:291 start_codon:yes stop_codon:yes gene_type:complete
MDFFKNSYGNVRPFMVLLIAILLFAAFNTTRKIEKMSMKDIQTVQEASMAEQQKVMSRMPQVQEKTLTQTGFKFERRAPWYIKNPMGGPGGMNINR